MTEKTADSPRFLTPVLALLVAGSLWGAAEVIVGSAMAGSAYPFRGGILTGLGMGLMAMVSGADRRPVLFPLIALIAMLVKMLAIPILHVTITCNLNSLMAVLIDGAAFGGVMYLAGHHLRQRRGGMAAVGAFAGAAAAISFYYIGMQIAPCNYLASFNRPAGLLDFMRVQGLLWAAFAALLVPVGHWAGVRATVVAGPIRTGRPALYYGSGSLIVLISWLASALSLFSQA